MNEYKNNVKNNEKSRKGCFQFIKFLPQKPLPQIKKNILKATL